MGKECGARFSRRLWGGSNTSPLKTTAWEAMDSPEAVSNLNLLQWDRERLVNECFTLGTDEIINNLVADSRRFPSIRSFSRVGRS